MSTKQIRLNAMWKVKNGIVKHFDAEIKSFENEEQYITAQTILKNRNEVVSIINDIIKKEKDK